jgi:glutamate formiminotransferase
MKKIVLCVPNISEGRDQVKISLIASAAETLGTKLLDVSPDANHNRAVISFAGEPNAVQYAAYLLITKAAELIDMSKHRGEHPRMGAVDVCPFIPVANMRMEECAMLAYRVGRAVGLLGLTGYFYGYTATISERKKLSDIRAGEYEALPEKLKKTEWIPDFGPARFNPKFGATVIGARDFLIAFNVNLRTLDLNLAQAIAALIRGSNEGVFPTVQAKGIDTRDKGYVQVSTNILDYRTDLIGEVFQAIKNFAAVEGVEVHSSEIIGLVPRDALAGVPIDDLRLKDFNPKKQIIEEALGL